MSVRVNQDCTYRRQAEDKLRRDKVTGKHAANRTHFEVGAKVRRTIKELGGTGGLTVLGAVYPAWAASFISFSIVEVLVVPRTLKSYFATDSTPNTAVWLNNSTGIIRFLMAHQSTRGKDSK